MADGPAQSGVNRLYWLDGMKGISILLIVFFHFLSAYDSGRYPWPFGIERFPAFIEQYGSSSFWGSLSCLIEACIVSVLERGPHAVGVFIILSGFGLTYSLTKCGGPSGGWGQWYRKRLLRLYPMYWIAHLVYLISPFVDRKDAVDYRFVLSFMGDRVYPVDQMFFYMNPALWFFGLLLELYLVFPLLFRLLQRIGPGRYLALCAVTTMVSRYVLFGVLETSGNYVQGALFTSRLWEFALGMTLAVYYRQRPALVEQWLFSWRTLLGGILVYTLGIYSYQPNLAYAWSDGLIGLGFFIIIAHAAKAARRVPWAGAVLMMVGTYSYGLYLLHQPYVIYLGQRLRGASILEFLLCAGVVVAIITLGSMALERLVNDLIGRLTTQRKLAPVPEPPSVC